MAFAILEDVAEDLPLPENKSIVVSFVCPVVNVDGHITIGVIELLALDKVINWWTSNDDDGRSKE